MLYISDALRSQEQRMNEMFSSDTRTHNSQSQPPTRNKMK